MTMAKSLFRKDSRTSVDDGESSSLIRSVSSHSYQSLNSALPNITFSPSDVENPTNINEEDLVPEDYLEKPESPQEKRLRFISLVVSFVILFLVAIQASLYWISLWPYLQSLDETISESFFGWIIMAYALAGAIASPAFGWWTNRIHGCRIPILTGLVLNILGNAILAFVESFPVPSRRWVFLGARVFSGIGAGNRGALFAYMAMSSKESERNRVMSIRGMIGSTSMLMGPGIQAAMVLIGYPGIVRGEFRLNTYTAASYFSIIFGVVGVVLMIAAFQDRWVSVAEKLNDETGKYEEMTMKSYDAITLWVCGYVRFAQVFVIAFDDSIGSPLSMLMFGWTKAQAVTYNGLINVSIGVIDIFCQWIVGNVVLNYVRERTVIVLGLFASLGVLLAVYPWPGLEPLIPDYATTATTTEGPYYSTISESNTPILNLYYSQTNFSLTSPNPCPYPWCSYTNRITLGQYLASFLFFIASISLGYIPSGTLFSKAVGPRRQGTWQGFFSFCGLMGMTVGPPLVSNMFQYAGLQAMYAVGFAVVGTALLMVGVFFGRLVSWSETVKNENS